MTTKKTVTTTKAKTMTMKSGRILAKLGTVDENGEHLNGSTFFLRLPYLPKLKKIKFSKKTFSTPVFSRQDGWFCRVLNLSVVALKIGDSTRRWKIELFHCGKAPTYPPTPTQTVSNSCMAISWILKRGCHFPSKDCRFAWPVVIVSCSITSRENPSPEIDPEILRNDFPSFARILAHNKSLEYVE